MTIESLPPENSSAGLRHSATSFTDDVDRLGVQPVEVVVLDLEQVFNPASAMSFMIPMSFSASIQYFNA